MRKALSVVLSVALGVFIPFMNYDFVNANNYKDSALEVKLINEKSRRSTILKKENEEKLNELGVYDEEINLLNEDALNEIDNGEIISVSSSYVREDEEGNRYTLSDTEIDELIESVYPNEINKKRKSKNSMFGTIDVEASEVNTGVSEDGYLKQTLILSYSGQTYKGMKVVNVECLSNWLKTPKNRRWDVVDVKLGNMTIEYNLPSSAYYSYREYNSANPGIIIESDMSKRLSVYSDENEVYTKFKLKSDSNALEYKKHAVSLNFKATTNSNVNKVSASAGYYHSTIEKIIEPYITVGSNGITVYVSVNSSEKIDKICRVNTMNFYFFK